MFFSDAFGRELEVRREAEFSPDNTYRYWLGRTWAPGPRIAFLMLNPSLADCYRDDPTVTRCIKRAIDGDFGGLDVINLFGWRSPYPESLELVADPIGPGNDGAILKVALAADMVVCAWGAHPFALPRARAVVEMLRCVNRPVHALGVTAGGNPRHPLHMPYSAKPQPYTL